MKKRVLLKTTVALLMAVLMLAMIPLEPLAVNFNVSRKLLQANSWWTPKIGVTYIAGTTNASAAYYHYYPTSKDLCKSGAYDFIVYGKTKTPMTGAVYGKSNKYNPWWTPVQLGYKDSSSKNSYLKIEADMRINNEYWFALGGQPNCSGDYTFTVIPHQDVSTSLYRDFNEHGKIWTRSTPSYYSDNFTSVDEVIFLTSYDLNILYSYLNEGLLARVKDYYSDGWDAVDSILQALDAIGFLIGMEEGESAEIFSLMYSIFTSALGGVLGLMRGGSTINSIVDFMVELENAGEIEHYWTDDGNYCHYFNNWVKISTISYEYSNYDMYGNYLGQLEFKYYDVESFSPYLFYAPKYARGTWEDWDYENSRDYISNYFN